MNTELHCTEIKQEIDHEKQELSHDQKDLDSSNLLDVSHSLNLDITEEFIISILKQVDELCDNIKNGDPDLERTLEVNQNLNEAVSCYRVKLLYKRIKSDAQDSEDFKYEIDPPDFFDPVDSDTEYVPLKKLSKKKKNKLKKGRIKEEDKSDKIIEDSTEVKVKNKGGRPRKVKPDLIIEDKKLFPFVKVNENFDPKDPKCSQRFMCSFCNQLYQGRLHCFRHLNNSHHTEIITIITKPDYKPESNNLSYDCKNRTCRKLYGTKRRELWCTQCTDLARMKKPKKKPLKPLEPKQNQLCPECGMSVRNLKRHLENLHFGEKQICSHCSKELPSLLSLKDHIRKVHEKLPCDQCGQLVATTLMKRHIDSQHTPNDQKKFKCDVCGKGFVVMAHLDDHKNIHTGEKPYKCKYCTMSFASRGTHGMHERKHLGYRRDYSKKKRS